MITDKLVTLPNLTSFNELLQKKNRESIITTQLTLANADKSKGAHLNVGVQDGLITLSPMTEDGSTPASLWVTDSASNNATELTGGTLSYVTDVGSDSEDWTSLSLVGDVVNVSGKGGATRRITNVADPVNDNDAVNKKSMDKIPSITNSDLSVSSTGTFQSPNRYDIRNTYWVDLDAEINLKKGINFIVAELYIENLASWSYFEHFLYACNTASGVYISPICSSGLIPIASSSLPSMCAIKAVIPLMGYCDSDTSINKLVYGLKTYGSAAADINVVLKSVKCISI